MSPKMPFTKAFLLLSLLLFLDFHSSSLQVAPDANQEVPTSDPEGPTSDPEGPTWNNTYEDPTSNNTYEDPTSNNTYEDPTSNSTYEGPTSNNTYEDPKIFTRILDKLLDGYDNRIRPGFDSGKPTVVLTDIHVISFGPVHDMEMEYSTDIFFRQRWKDERLKFKGPISRLTLHSKVAEKIWVPDTHFHNSKLSEVRNETVPNVVLQLEEDGTLLYTMRITINADCHLKLHNFPMDAHTCPLTFGSLGHTIDEINYVWDKSDGEGLTVAEGASRLTQFDLVSSWTNRTVARTSLGKQAVMKANFHLTRRLGYFFLQSYLPCIVTVLVSQLSLWLNREAVPARTVCSVTTVLTLTTLGLAARSTLPGVASATSLDGYLAVSYMFAFATLLEFAAVSTFTKRLWAWDGKAVRENKRIKEGEAPEEAAAAVAPPAPRGPRGPEEIEMQDLASLRSRRQAEGGAAGAEEREASMDETTYNSVSKIDEACRFIFPLAYLLYNIFYWQASLKAWQ